MRLHITCKRCQHAWTLADEPREVVALSCPKCESVAEPRASEDLASALEDALCQLWLLSQSIEVEVTLDTRSIPPAFRPLDSSGQSR